MSKRSKGNIYLGRCRNIQGIRKDLKSKGYNDYKIKKILIAYGEKLDCFEYTIEFFNDIGEIIHRDKESFNYFISNYTESNIEKIKDYLAEKRLRVDMELAKSYINAYIKKFHKEIEYPGKNEDKSDFYEILYDIIVDEEWDNFREFTDKRSDKKKALSDRRKVNRAKRSEDNAMKKRLKRENK